MSHIFAAELALMAIIVKEYPSGGAFAASPDATSIFVYDNELVDSSDSNEMLAKAGVPSDSERNYIISFKQCYPHLSRNCQND